MAEKIQKGDTHNARTLGLLGGDLQIGDVFTPLQWAGFAIEKFGLFQKWLKGASIFDPTMGDGNLLEAFVVHGLSKGMAVTELPVERLFGNEMNTSYYNKALRKFTEKYNCKMQANFSNSDLLECKKKKYNIIFGNPPWKNFVDLPDSYKEKTKPYFFKYDLIESSQNLLLGGSRIDIAALIIQVAIKDFLKTKGEAVFFMPLSLLLNDGANGAFRTYSIGKIQFSPETVYDFNKLNVFEGISTRHGLTRFLRNKKASFPLPYYIMYDGKWTEYQAMPIFRKTDPLSITTKGKEAAMAELPAIALKKESVPRQGINTCGANEVFFFDTMKEKSHELVEMSNKIKSNIVLPKQFVFPLISTNNFREEDFHASKWVLLPYNSDGKALKWPQIQDFPSLEAYLNANQNKLQNRKGTLLNALLNRGYWWSLLGVGEYCFFPYKVVWEAYGRSTFKPKIFSGNCQANQSLQAFIPLRTHRDAKRILLELSDPRVESYLLSLKMEGTMNWAQPGKIKKLLKLSSPC